MTRRHCVPLGAVLLMGLLWGGCFSSEQTQLPPDQRFGHRYEASRGPEGRLNISLTQPDPAQEYFYYPAPLDTVHVRPEPFTRVEGQEPYTRVELLLKGSFPDACTELHEVGQEQAGHIINVDVTMRRSKGAVCRRAMRPYRYYVLLDGTFRPGDYTLKVNGYNYTFTLRLPHGG